MSTPAGWYPTGEGRLRFWDGAQWTEHVAPDPSRPPAAAVVVAPPHAHATGVRRGPGAAGWWGWGGLAATALLGLVTSGVSGLTVLAGTYILAVAVVALIRGHVDWARIRGRAAAGVALGAALGLFVVGGATASPAPEPPVQESATHATPTLTTSAATSSASESATPTSSPTPTATPSPSAPATAGTALAAAAALAVKGRAPRTGYDRDKFGPAWYDADRNGCDTRNDTLRRDLKDFTLKAGTHGCLVLSGTLTSPYTGKAVEFVRGGSTSAAVQIDHVVPLSDAWQKGAQLQSPTTRTAFANDPLNLLAVDRATNAEKSDGDAATWLPPSKSYRCAYVARQVAVKAKYHLWVTAAERDAIVRILRTCPAQKLPTAKAVPLGGGRVVSATPRPGPSPTRTSTGLDPRFGTCAEANDAGYGPYHSGKDPEYDWYRDRDRDGIVCER